MAPSDTPWLGDAVDGGSKAIFRSLPRQTPSKKCCSSTRKKYAALIPASKRVVLGVGFVMLLSGVTVLGRAVRGTSVRLEESDRSATTALIMRGPTGMILVPPGPEGTPGEVHDCLV